MSTLNPTALYLDNVFKTPARNAKLFKSRALNDENTMVRGNGLSGKIAGYSARRPNDKVTVDSNPLSEITNKTPHQKKNKETINLAKSFVLLDIDNQDSKVAASCRRLSSTRKTIRLPNSAQKNLNTPVSGNPWDVSDVFVDDVTSDVELLPIEDEDEDEVEFCPSVPLDLEFPDYTVARRIFNCPIAHEAPKKVYEIDVSFEVYEPITDPLIDEDRVLFSEIFSENSGSGRVTEHTKPSSTRTKANVKAAAGHTRIPSLSRGYVASSMVKGKLLNIQTASNSIPPLRSSKSNMRAHNTPFHTSVSTSIYETKIPQSSKYTLSDDIVTGLFDDHFETPDMYFEI